EIALRTEFHSLVLRSETFQKNMIGLVIDESYSISEWGTDNFQCDYSIALELLCRHLPGDVPVLIASVTLPHNVITNIQIAVGLTDQC
ncbi:hypothetical protein ARMGADRAFT_926116, partial [Armillaria gallica]